MQEELHLYAQALADYCDGNWIAAQTGFSNLQVRCDNTALTQVFLDRIGEFSSIPPVKDWDGVYSFGSKCT